MSEIIKAQIEDAKAEIKALHKKSISDDRAFSHVLLKYVYGVEYDDQEELVTDGNNDGGIDFLYFDEEESKLILCQSKYKESILLNDVINEINKMYSTVQNFKISNTGSYNDKLKLALQNAIDRLPEDNSDNIEYQFFTTAPLDVNSAKRKIANDTHEFPDESVVLFTEADIEKCIQDAQGALSTVKEEKIEIDIPNNLLKYDSSENTGIMCNVSSRSIIQLYNKYASKGLFDLNIRRYIRNTLVDSGINKSLEDDRPNFWFLNNGIIIACENFWVDGNKIHLENFSIVNGGQTTSLIGKYKGNNTQEFYIPCKIVATNDDTKAEFFFTKIAEATNSQKPIFARDLKSNAKEMVSLQSWLKQDKKIYLEIKRGHKPSFKPSYALKNDELGQLILSFVMQRPGTSRSGKKVIFENQSIYDQIFKVNYAKTVEKKQCLLDIINLKQRFDEIEKKLKGDNTLTASQKGILKNGKQTIFAILGVLYRIANNDIEISQITDNPRVVANVPFEYGPIISNYHEDDIDEKLTMIINCIIDIIAEDYEKALENETTTSISNFMKTDSKYYTEIISYFVKQFKFTIGKEILNRIDIFKR